MSSPVLPKRADPSGQDPAQKKRRKGATRLSCAECRRLKLRCDRTIPCSSCVKRGCAAICPDGSLTTGQGNRFVLASTQELHEKISQLSTRVRELEDALRSSHGQLSHDAHPLLSEELLKIKAPLQRDPQAAVQGDVPAGKEEEGGPDVSDALGTLALSKSGRARYYGGPAGSWYFLQNENEEEPERAPTEDLINLQNLLPPEILTRASAFPISSNPATPLDNVSQQALIWYLPPGDQAENLRDIYFTRAAWLYNPISREEFDEFCFTTFYDQNNNLQSHPDEDPSVAHKLSLLFMVLAIGCLLDPGQAPYNANAEKFNQLGRAALFLNPFVEEPTIHAVQTLHLMTFYLFLLDRHGVASGIRWAIMGLATKVAQSIGLHRDSSKWRDVDPAETQRRRQTFWELFTYDSWQCLTFGRPPSFSLAHLDCKMPFSGEPTDENAFHVWKYRFTSDCMNALHDQAYNAKAPTYATVLQLDRKLRAFPVPSMLQIAGFGSAEPRAAGSSESIALMLQRHLVLSLREANLLFLHRSFFARAISEHPQDPLGSPYGTSVIAAYRSAGSLIALMKNLRNQLREPTDRMWFLWSHSFTSAIILGSIVTKCPSMSLAPSALVQLDSACDLFEKAARGFRAERVYNIMNDLRQRSHIALNEFRSGKGSGIGRTPGLPGHNEDSGELWKLGGQSRLVKKEPSAQPQSPSTTHLSSPVESPIVALPMPVVDSQMDSNLLEYLHSFNQAGPPPLSSMPPSGEYTSELSAAMPMFSMSPISPNPAYTSDSHMSYMVNSGPSTPSTIYPPQQQLSPRAQHQQQHPQHRQHSQHQHQQQYQPHQPHQQLPQQQMQPQPAGPQNLHQQQTMYDGMMNGMGPAPFPQYFPVFDYGVSGPGSDDMFGQMMEQMPGQQQPQRHRSTSASPEGNTLNSTWNDFIASSGYAMP